MGGLKDTPAPPLKVLRDLAPRAPRFLSLCNFFMLVWVQGSVFQIAAGSHPEQEIWGSHDSLYRDQIQKLLRCCREPYQHATDSSCYNDSEKTSIVLPIDDHDDVPFRSYWRKVKCYIFGSTGVKQVKMIRFCWQWSQNVYQVNTMKIIWDASLLWLRNKNGQPMDTNWLHNHVTVTCYT